MKRFPFFAMANKLWRCAKVAKASDAAFRLWMDCISYSSDEATDGLIDEGALRLLRADGPRKKALEQAVKAGLLERDGDCYRVHDYLEHQTSAALRQASDEGRREATRARVAQHRASKKAERVTQNSVTGSVTSSAGNALVTGEEKKRRREEDLQDHERAKDSCPRGAPSEPDELARSEVRPRSAEPPPPVVRRGSEPSSTRLAADWTPTADELGGVGAPSGAPAEYVADQLLAFRGHFCPRSDEDTHNGWVSRFTGWVGRGWSRDRARWSRERETDSLRSGAHRRRRGEAPQPTQPEDLDYLRAQGWIT